MYKQIILFCLGLLTISTQINAQAPVERGLRTINRNNLEAQLTFLSSNWFEGREATTKGAFMTADYLASLYQSAGLEPLNEHSYFEDVPLLVAQQPKTATITLQSEQQSKTFTFPTHIRAERVPQSLSLNSEIIWGGYGINHQTLKEISTNKSKGKILLRLSGLPMADENSALEKFLQAKTEQEWQQIKNTSLKDAAVIAVLEYDLNDPYLKQSLATSPDIKADAEEELSKRSSGIYNKSFFLQDEPHKGPYIYKVSKLMMEELIPDFDQVIKEYTTHLQHLSTKTTIDFTYQSIQLETEANVELKHCRNVIAMIEGSEKPDEIIVVGAHYDHLGSYNGYIWNGADDNGSGAIGVVAIARAFKAMGIQPKRTVIFANWTAEERGLFGSRHFVKHYQDMNKVKYYHNYDMIGRSYNYEQPDSAVSLLYTKAWGQAEELCRKYNTEHQLGLKINYSAWDNPTSGSDNAPFAKKGVPIMWFHTGGHESYHMPSDHADRIDWQKLEAIVKTSFLSLWNLANE